jgi:hypothetical protein
LDDAGWSRGEEIVADVLSTRPPKVIGQMVLFLRVVNVLSVVRFGRSFARLSSPQADRLLGRLERSPLLLLRRGGWGARTLGFMAFYAQPDVASGLGYRAIPGGWGARSGGQGAWDDRAGAAGPEPDVVSMLDGTMDT